MKLSTKIALKTCVIGNERRSFTLRKH